MVVTFGKEETIKRNYEDELSEMVILFYNLPRMVIAKVCVYIMTVH